MRRLRSYSFFKHLVLIFLASYLFGLFSNMFFIQRYTLGSVKTRAGSESAFSNAIKSVSYRTANFLQVIDRSTLDNDQSNTLNFFPKCILLIFAGLGFFKLGSIQIRTLSAVFYNQRYAYLSFCTFRI